MTNKICVYAICKNEAKYVDKWVDSMSEADYVVVLDTGSTDNTVELLRARGVKVEVKEIKPWRFDVARNESLKLVPEDANILFCTDLDEVLEPGWAQVLRDKWVEGTHVRAQYKYAWSHFENGTPARVFAYSKIHDRNWHWEYHVHELLLSDKYDTDKIFANFDHVLNVFDDITLHHYPDPSKSRNNYLDLLIQRRQAYTDTYSRLYLAHEYMYHAQYQNSINELNLLLKECDDLTELEKASCYIFLGKDYANLGDEEKALSCFLRAITEDPYFREGYLYSAELYNKMGLYTLSVGLVKQALAVSQRRFFWLEEDRSWAEQPYDILSVAYYFLGELDLSYANCMKAMSINDADERLRKNYEAITKAWLNK